MKKTQFNKFKEHSKELEQEFSGSPENTHPLSNEDREWLRTTLERSDETKIPVTIRLSRWQIEEAKRLASRKRLRGYQTLIRQLLSEALIAQH